MIDLVNGPLAELLGEAVRAHVVAGPEDHDLLDRVGRPGKGIREAIVDVPVTSLDVRRQAAEAFEEPAQLAAALESQKGGRRGRTEEMPRIWIVDDTAVFWRALIESALQSDDFGSSTGTLFTH